MLSFTKGRAQGCALQIIASKIPNYVNQIRRDKWMPTPDTHVDMTAVRASEHFANTVSLIPS